MVSEYSSSFYEQLNNSSLESAKEIVPLLLELFSPQSVVDMGCGLGQFLSVFRDCGMRDILGVEGEWVKEVLNPLPDWLLVHNLEEPLVLKKSYDLVLCLEVAEHLDYKFSETLVQSLTKASSRIVFSAAIPGQGGTGHINLQSPEYWARKFADYGFFLEHDLRSRIWKNSKIAPWYRQNLLIYARGLQTDQLLVPDLLKHPEIFPSKLTALKTGLRRRLRILVRAV